MTQINRAIEAVGVEFNGNVEAIKPFLVEVQLNKTQQGTMANRIRETLERIGTFAADTPDVLNQVAHLITIEGRQYIAHFKFLYLIYHGTDNRLKESDIARQNNIIKMMQNWDFITVVNPDQLEGIPEGTPAGVKVVRHGEKANWKLTPKFRRQRVEPKADAAPQQ